MSIITINFDVSYACPDNSFVGAAYQFLVYICVEKR